MTNDNYFFDIKDFFDLLKEFTSYNLTELYMALTNPFNEIYGINIPSTALRN